MGEPQIKASDTFGRHSEFLDWWKLGSICIFQRIYLTLTGSLWHIMDNKWLLRGLNITLDNVDLDPQ